MLLCYANELTSLQPTLAEHVPPWLFVCWLVQQAEVPEQTCVPVCTLDWKETLVCCVAAAAWNSGTVCSAYTTLASLLYARFYWLYVHKVSI